jgi:hypothetical protein
MLGLEIDWELEDELGRGDPELDSASSAEAFVER